MKYMHITQDMHVQAIPHELFLHGTLLALQKHLCCGREVAAAAAR